MGVLADRDKDLKFLMYLFPMYQNQPTWFKNLLLELQKIEGEAVVE